MEARSSKDGGCGKTWRWKLISMVMGGVDGEGQEKVLKLLLKFKTRNRKEDRARVVGCWP